MIFIIMNSLATLIKERKKNNMIFSEEEIWQIISDIKLVGLEIVFFFYMTEY